MKIAIQTIVPIVIFITLSVSVFAQITSRPIDGVYTTENDKRYDTVYFADFFGTVRNKNFLIHSAWREYLEGNSFDNLVDKLMLKYPMN